jgi:pimeloyl-ACP methyl ester carboxylesterase
MVDYVYDLAQLVHQKQLHPINIIGHSLGGSVSLEYAGLYPKNVRRIIAIEGLGPPVSSVAKRQNQPLVNRISEWIEMVRELASRSPRHYASIEEAVNRLQEANPRLSPSQAYHLTIHGTNQKEDGTYVWKFDNYVRTTSPYQFDSEDATQLWKFITCPTLLISGAESWSGDPEKDGRISHFQNAKALRVQNAGHWVHHDQLKTIVDESQKFLV